uniref:Copia protein n=1 Tax=Tanacetum cinerariifolium TaxID=118510 RepID=A0A6L2KYL6_TANCI|nr:copia protein [Tanacetum cinerariifolium]
MGHLIAKFELIGFECLVNINEQIVPRFVYEFYSQLTFDYNPEGHFVVNFFIQNKSFALTVKEFGQILKSSFEGHVSYTDMWLLDYLAISTPSKGLYKTIPPSLRVIKSLIQTHRQGQVTRTRRGHRNHVPVCLCHMLYCIETSTQYNLAFFILKRMESIQNKPKELLPYGMLLTRLFNHVASNFPELAIDRYILYDRVMHPLAPHYKRKTRSNHDTKRCRDSNHSSSSTALNHSSSSHHIDENVDDNEPDIMFSVCLCARFQGAPKTSHLEAVKRIFQYIKGTTHLGLWYPDGTGIETIVYADFDHAGDYVERKITSGIYTFMGCCLTSWFSKKQTALAISTTEAEYVSAEKACQQAQWMKQALIDYDVRLNDVPIMCDNKGAIDLSKNPMQHSRTKYIEIRYHFLRDNVQKGHISIEKVPSVNNIANILTNPFKRESFDSKSWFRNDGTHSINHISPLLLLLSQF